MNLYTLTFVGDYFTLTTNIYAYDIQDASDKAIENMADLYGFDLESSTNDIDIELAGE
jgi:hypothetical protein